MRQQKSDAEARRDFDMDVRTTERQRIVIVRLVPLHLDLRAMGDGPLAPRLGVALDQTHAYLILKRGTDDRDDVCGFPQRKSGRGGGCQEDVRRELNQLSCQDRQLLEMAAAKRYTMLRFRPSS